MLSDLLAAFKRLSLIIVANNFEFICYNCKIITNMRSLIEPGDFTVLFLLQSKMKVPSRNSLYTLKRSALIIIENNFEYICNNCEITVNMRCLVESKAFNVLIFLQSKTKMPSRHQPYTLKRSALIIIANNFESICYNCETTADMRCLIESGAYMDTKSQIFEMRKFFKNGLTFTIINNISKTKIVIKKKVKPPHPPFSS